MLQKPHLQIQFILISYFGGCQFPRKYFASQRHADFTSRARDHRQANEFQVYVRRRLSAFATMCIQGHRRQMIVSHHLKEDKKIKSSLLQFLPVYTILTGLHCNTASIRHRGIRKQDFNNYKPRISCAAGYSRKWSRTGQLCSWRKI